MRHGARVLACVAALAVTAGCGTTVSVSAGTGADTGLGEPSPTGGGPVGSGGIPAAAGAAAGNSTTGASGAVSGVAGVGSGRSAAAGSGVAAVPGAPGATGASAASVRGVTGTSVYLGVQYVDDAGQVMNAIGANGPVPSQKTYEDTINGVVAYINARGGIAGKKVIPVFRGDSLTSNDYSTTAQATCEFFTRDHPVFAVMSEYPGMQNLAVCLAQRHVPFLYQLLPAEPASYINALLPYWYSVPDLTGSHLGIWIDRLAAMGYFSGWDTTRSAASKLPAKLGLIAYGTGGREELNNVIEPRLVAHGLRLDPADVYEMSIPQGFTYASQDANEIANAVLKFRSDGVTHVLFFGTGGAGELLFGPEAQSQHYYPRWAVNSYESLSSIVEPDDPPAELNGAMGTGWAPIQDVQPSQDPGGNPAAQRCERILAHAGISPARQFTPLQFCDDLFFLRTALGAASAVDADALYAAVEALGSRFQSVMTLTGKLRFQPGQVLNSISQVRDLVYEHGCGCFKYSGPIRPVP